MWTVVGVSVVVVACDHRGQNFAHSYNTIETLSTSTIIGNHREL